MTPDPSAPAGSPEPARNATSPADRLQALAAVLLRRRAPGSPAVLVGLDVDTERLSLSALDGYDPVADLVGRVAPPDLSMVGIVTGARARLLDEPSQATCGTFVHLVDRSGTAISLMGLSDDDPLQTGPDDRPMVGRAPDACRRMLGLPTAPPIEDMRVFVVDAWLALIADAALDHPSLPWSELTELHPAGPPSAATPATVARITTRFGAELDWERFRQACVAGGPPPYVSIDSAAADWMDAGMFARWLTGEMPPWESMLDLLEGVLTPGVSDRLRAAVTLCRRPDVSPAARLRTPRTR